MTVQQLIGLLSQFDPNCEVRMASPTGGDMFLTSAEVDFMPEDGDAPRWQVVYLS